MATPDLSTLTSSAQVFASTHTLPQIRSIHKALHAEADDRAARLRSQVGASYRDLLGTAETIVHMRTDMDAVQTTLGRMGGRCGRAVVGAKVAGLARFVEERGDGMLAQTDDEPRIRSLGLAARVRLLEACALAVSRVLGRGTILISGQGDGPEDKKRPASRGDRLALAAKILVLSRLLDMSLAQNQLDPAVASAVGASRKSLAASKRRLLAALDRTLEQTGDRGDILNALGAYSLATSSGARDVLWHFLHVRAQAMALAFELDEGERACDPQDVLACLQLYTSTLLDVQALAPAKLAEALAGLKKSTLLADKSLQSLESLRLDVLKRWCGDEIQYFTPFIRHDDLDGKQAREMLASWAQKGGQVLLDGLRKTLHGMTEFKSIVELRTSVLKLWISEGGKARGFDPSEMLDEIRDIINKHMLEVLEAKVSKLRLVGSDIANTLDGWRAGVTDKHESLWDEGTFDTELAHGAAQFTQDVIARLYGRNDAVSKTVASYTSWYRVIDDVGQVVDQLKRQRWDNDVDEIEDEDTIEHRQQLLSRDDPQQLLAHRDASLVKAFGDLDERLSSSWDTHGTGANKAGVARYLIRVTRDIRARLPDLEPTQGLGLSLVPSLHEVLAGDVVAAPLDEFQAATLLRKSAAGTSLWEGTPALPATPSPGAFRFLRSLCLAMGDAGADLWSPPAVAALKKMLVGRLAETWTAVLETRLAEVPEKDEKVSEGKEGDEEPKEGDEEAPGKDDGDVIKETKDVKAEEEHKSQDAPLTPEQRSDLLTQWFFDISYLRCGLQETDGSTGTDLDTLTETIYQASGLDEAGARQRVVKASQDYWKRTSLLFGIIA